MRIYFGGSEVKMWRDLLAEQKVPNVALSFVGLLRRNKNNFNITDNWSIDDHYPDYQNIFLDSGAFTLNRDDANYSRDEALELSLAYANFALKNKDRVSLISEFDAQQLGVQYIREMRESFYDKMIPADKFMPIWHPEYGVEDLEYLCSSYAVVGITAIDIGDKSLIPTLNSFASRYGTRLHGVAITGRKMLKEIRWYSVASMSWLSPSRYGDTIIWVGNELKRYPKAYKDKARKQHGEYLKRNGFDLDKIQEDDSKEILKLSLWSWMKFAETLERSGVTNISRNRNVHSAEIDGNEVDTQGTSEWKGELLPAVPETSSFELALRGQTSEVKTVEQRKVLLSALIDMQAQRVLELKKAEDRDGILGDINLSAESDRLAKYIRQQNEMEKQSFSLKIEASAPAGPGIMSTMFGPNVAEKLNDNPPSTTAEVMNNDEVHEAELV